MFTVLGFVSEPLFLERLLLLVCVAALEEFQSNDARLETSPMTLVGAVIAVDSRAAFRRCRSFSSHRFRFYLPSMTPVVYVK